MLRCTCWVLQSPRQVNLTRSFMIFHAVPRRNARIMARDLRKKDKVRCNSWHESVGLCQVLLRFFVYKYHCRGCGRYFHQRLEGILPWQSSSEALKKQVYRNHTHGVLRKILAQNFRKSDSTISCYHCHMHPLQNSKLLTLQMPRVLGIDKHFFSRQMRFATTSCDFKKRRVFDVAPGQLMAALTSYLDRLKGGKARWCYLYGPVGNLPFHCAKIPSQSLYRRRPVPCRVSCFAPFDENLPHN